jgi:hypothetical protein
VEYLGEGREPEEVSIGFDVILAFESAILTTHKEVVKERVEVGNNQEVTYIVQVRDGRSLNQGKGSKNEEGKA